MLALDIDDSRLAVARTLGADRTQVIDRDATPEQLRELVPDGADVVIESSGVPGGAARAYALAARGGTVLLVGLTQAPQPLQLADVVLREVDIRTTVAHVCGTDLPAALDLLTSRPLASVLVDRVVGLEDVVPDGFEPLVAGAAHGKILVDPAMADVAVLGTGRMGAAMARRVALAGHRVTVLEPHAGHGAGRGGRAARGADARVASTAAEAVQGRDVVLSMLADGSATCAVLLDSDVTAALRQDAIVCDLATSGVAAARALADGLGARGVGFVDAPVSGSVPAVDAGTLLVMAAGEPSAVDAVRPVLEAFARKVVRVGDAGAGQAMKLAVNLVVHDLNTALSEALVLAERSGITREKAYDVLAGQRRRGPVRRLQARRLPGAGHPGGDEPGPGAEGPAAGRRACPRAGHVGRDDRCG